VLGNEKIGLFERQLCECHEVICLPGNFSLNVAVAGSMVMDDRVVKTRQPLPEQSLCRHAGLRKRLARHPIHIEQWRSKANIEQDPCHKQRRRLLRLGRIGDSLSCQPQAMDWAGSAACGACLTGYPQRSMYYKTEHFFQIFNETN